MSYAFYKIMHIVGLAFLLVGLGSMLILSLTGQMQNKKAKTLTFACHGIGLLIMFVAGFGLAARLGLTTGFPNWMLAKIGIWIVLGLAISVIKRRPQWTFASLIVIVGLVGTASWLAVMKPF
ncbi:MAG: hypothetical protein ACK5P7_01700 [Bdellovibrio sp.]|jgi:hypothetical protein